MTKRLTPDEKKTIDLLEREMDQRLEAYRKEKQRQLRDGKRGELTQELESLEGYLRGCANGEIADVLPNIEFAQKKREILRHTLSQGAPAPSSRSSACG